VNVNEEHSGSGFFSDPGFIRSLSLLVQEWLLRSDVAKAREGLEDDPTEYHRRQYVRAVFAQLEGSTFSIKQLALSEDLSLLTHAEIALLRGELYRLNDAGDAIISTAFLTLANDMKFAFKVYARTVGLNYELPVREPGWSALLQAKRVRDRLMHPRSAADLSVTDEELGWTTKAGEWFEQKFNQLSELMMDQLSRNRGMSEEEVRAFREERDKIVRRKLIERTELSETPPR
jgi:hypothetical protein